MPGEHFVAKDEFDDRARCLRFVQHRVEADGRGLSMVLDAGQRGLRLQPDPNGCGVERWKPRLDTGLQLPNVEIEQTQFGMSATALLGRIFTCGKLRNIQSYLVNKQ